MPHGEPPEEGLEGGWRPGPRDPAPDEALPPRLLPEDSNGFEPVGRVFRRGSGRARRGRSLRRARVHEPVHASIAREPKPVRVEPWPVAVPAFMRQSAETFYARVFALSVAVLLGYALLRIVQPFVGPIVWAALLAFLLFPAYEKLRRKLGKRGSLAPLLMTFAVTLGIVLPVAILVITFAGQATDLIDRLTRTADRYQIAQPQDVLRLPFLKRAVEWISSNVPVTVEQLQTWVVNGLRTALEFALTNSRFVFLGALGAFVGLTLMLFVLYFFFRDGREIAVRSLALIPLDDRTQEDPHRPSLAGHAGRRLRLGPHGPPAGRSGRRRLCHHPASVAGRVRGHRRGRLSRSGRRDGVVVVPATIVLAAQGRWGMAIFMTAWGVVVVGLADNSCAPCSSRGEPRSRRCPSSSACWGAGRVRADRPVSRARHHCSRTGFDPFRRRQPEPAETAAVPSRRSDGGSRSPARGGPAPYLGRAPAARRAEEGRDSEDELVADSRAGSPRGGPTSAPRSVLGRERFPAGGRRRRASIGGTSGPLTSRRRFRKERGSAGSRKGSSAALRFLWRDQTSFNAAILECLRSVADELGRSRAAAAALTAEAWIVTTSGSPSPTRDSRCSKSRRPPGEDAARAVSASPPALPPGVYTLFEDRFRGEPAGRS